MKLHVLAAFVAAAAPLAWAADPADPAAPAPRPAYRSVFEGLPAGVEEQVLPWKQANTAVAEFPRGHIDLLKWEEAQGKAAPTPPAPPHRPPAAPAPGAHAH